MLVQAHEDRLKHIGGSVVAESGAPRHGVDQALEAQDQLLPGPTLAAAAGRDQLGIGSG